MDEVVVKNIAILSPNAKLEQYPTHLLVSILESVLTVYMAVRR